MVYQPFCSTDIDFLSKNDLISSLKKYINMNLVVVLSTSAAKRWGMVDVMQTMKEQNNVVWINKINANPTSNDICLAIKEIQMQKVDLIIAIGGGSTIDLAKGISAFYDYSGACLTTNYIIESIKSKAYQYKKEYIDILAIPSTSGTGSEITQWATIWDKDNQMKYSIDSVKLKPKKAIIVPELTLTMNSCMTLATGLDALSHATEAYWSIYTNSLIQELAIRSIHIILDTMKQLLKDLDKYELRDAMSRASVLAGLAFSKTRTTACHSISYPLTMCYKIPHGYAVAMTLGEVSKRNKGKFPNDMELYNLFEAYGGIQAWIDEICSGITKLRLSNFNIQSSDIIDIAQKSFSTGRMNNNPVQLTEKDVVEILESIIE